MVRTMFERLILLYKQVCLPIIHYSVHLLKICVVLVVITGCLPNLNVESVSYEDLCGVTVDQLSGMNDDAVQAWIRSNYGKYIPLNLEVLSDYADQESEAINGYRWGGE